MISESTVNELIQKIKNAFANVAYPGDEKLTNSFGEEAEALKKDFRRKTDWTLLTPEFLNQAPDGWSSALSFFSAEALQFYLPAYLIADIEGALDCTDATSRLCSFVMPQLENRRIARIYGGGTLGEYARADFERLSASQVSAIVAYLWWKLDKEGYAPIIDQALENYWLQREAELNKKSSRSK